MAKFNHKKRKKNEELFEHVVAKFKEDGILYMCPVQRTQTKNNKCYVKWHDGKHYEAEILKRAGEAECNEFIQNYKENDAKARSSLPASKMKQPTNKKKSTEYVVVQYECDGVFYMCPAKDVQSKNNVFSAKWCNGRYYTAHIMHRGDKKECSEFLKELEFTENEKQIKTKLKQLDNENDTSNLDSNKIPNIVTDTADVAPEEQNFNQIDSDKISKNESERDYAKSSDLNKISGSAIVGITNTTPEKQYDKNYSHIHPTEICNNKKEQDDTESFSSNKIPNIVTDPADVALEEQNFSQIDSDKISKNESERDYIESSDLNKISSSAIVAITNTTLEKQYDKNNSQIHPTKVCNSRKKQNDTQQLIPNDDSYVSCTESEISSEPEYSSDSWRENDSEDDVFISNKKRTFLTELKKKQRLQKKADKRWPGLVRKDMPENVAENLEKSIEDVLDTTFSNCFQDNTNSVKTTQHNTENTTPRCRQENKKIPKNSQKNAENQDTDSETELYSVTVNQKSPSKPKWRKKQICKFCLQEVVKLLRHVTTKHKEQSEVINLMSFNKLDPKRLQILEKLRNDGRLLHNRKILANGNGELKTKRRIINSANGQASDYLPCSNCKVMIKNSYFLRHRKKCLGKDWTRCRTAKTESSLLLKNVATSVSEMFRQDILSKMQVDEIYDIIISDKLILQLGMQFYKKLGTRSKNKNYIACKMREIAKFVGAMREVTNNPYRTLTGCLKSKEIDNIIRAVRKLCGYNEKTMRFATPTNVLKIGHSINKCLVILMGESVQNGDLQKENELSALKRTINALWPSECSSNALLTLKDKRFNRTEYFPLAEDIKQFNDYLKREIRLLIEKIQDDPDGTSLMNLARLSLCLIIVFNRRRAGEVQKMLLSHVEKVSTGDVNPDIMKNLSPFEQKLATSLSRFEIVGKRYRKVPILLSKLLKDAVDLLKSDVNRQIMGIHPENPYFYAIPGTVDSTLSATQQIRKYAALSGAKNHLLIRSTILRKHFASMCQLYNLDDNDMDIIADFMGHDIKVHRQFYRLPQSTLQLIRMGKMITNREHGMSIEVQDTENMQIEEFLDIDENEDDLSDDDVCVNKPKSIDTVVQSKKKSAKSKNEPTKSKNIVVKRRWSDEENNIILKYFEFHINNRSIPSKEAAEKCLKENEGIFNDRNWRNVKDKVRNMFK